MVAPRTAAQIRMICLSRLVEMIVVICVPVRTPSTPPARSWSKRELCQPQPLGQDDRRNCGNLRVVRNDYNWL